MDIGRKRYPATDGGYEPSEEQGASDAMNTSGAKTEHIKRRLGHGFTSSQPKRRRVWVEMGGGRRALAPFWEQWPQIPVSTAPCQAELREALRRGGETMPGRTARFDPCLIST